ncbi:c-type cytochrome [Roseococcus pinisoli]|uniref:Cytochrome c family protein n=1 Tax=Roseococcus pinisoli TaxID=2835040 RepID=A0ABS5QHD5_9PROT|nr:cytochrome c family protein [Roseococcus pinisoli]MBS7812972.1 cytochrome c family protein [Roseococcus pinisoli]
MRFTIMAAALLAFAPWQAKAQDVAAGQRVFNQCRACHTINAGGRNGVGPNLHGVWDRAAGAVEGFRYSAPMRERAAAGLVWNEENLLAYITDPKAVVPRGSMSYVGLRNEQQRNDLMAYLREASTAAN